MQKLTTFFLIFAMLGAFYACQTNPNPGTMTSSGENLTLGTKIDSTDSNNNFYDNVEVYPLPGGALEVAGEISNPGNVDFAKLPKRSVIVKETLLQEDGSDAFVGAYRYDGYSLFDILAERILEKKNREEFPPIIDLFVEIENAAGEKVVVSWGEIYYPNILHQIIIATDVARIVPSKTKDLWPLPAKRKLIMVNDLLTERNISDPVKITVKSCEKSFPINRELNPLWSPEVRFTDNGSLWLTLTAKPEGASEETLHTIFYGKGRGIHSTQPFTGYPLREVLTKQVTPTPVSLRNGLVLISAADGYRCIYSLSEIVNRNDQADILMIPVTAGEDGGLYRLFPSCDFFSDRAVKAVSTIELTY